MCIRVQLSAKFFQGQSTYEFSGQQFYKAYWKIKSLRLHRDGICSLSRIINIDHLRNGRELNA